MLNWAARYFPILRVLRQRLGKIDSLLEIGSGSVGIGRFYRAPFVGCDVNFEFEPEAPMRAVIASATDLPFDDRSFDAVVVSDVLEHIPPEDRTRVVCEALRVTRKIAVFGFPSGPQAFDCDVKLLHAYDKNHRKRPTWLKEHMLYPFPTESIFENLRQDWIVESFGNENLNFHYWMMRKEMYRPWDFAFRVLLALAPTIIESMLRKEDKEPYYREIVVFERRSIPDLATA